MKGIRNRFLELGKTERFLNSHHTTDTMNRSVLSRLDVSQLPKPTTEPLTDADPASVRAFLKSVMQDAVMKQLYREIADLKVRNELLEQSLRSAGCGL